MIHLNVVRESDDKLRRQVWTFWYYDNRHALVLDGYRDESRDSLRRKIYKVEGSYSRISRREATMKEAEVPLPQDVIHEVIEQFNATLQVLKWAEIR